MANFKPKNIDEYIAGFPPDLQDILQEVRQTIREAAPDAEETISYDMPTFNIDGSYLVYFAGWKKHVALYPVTSAMLEALKDDAFNYKGTKGSIHFPLNKPMPLELISRIVALRLEEHSKARK